MNMKKTMAAIAAGAVAVSAMATTVSAATLETKTITYNLVRTEKTGADAEVKLTAKFYNVPLQDGKSATFTIKNLNKKDIVRISGVYIEEGKQIVPIVATADQEQGGIYSRATDLLITKDGNGDPTGTIVVPINATNANAGAAFMGGPAEATVATAGTPGTAAVNGTGTAAWTTSWVSGGGAAPAITGTVNVAKLVEDEVITADEAVAGTTVTCNYTHAGTSWNINPATYGLTLAGTADQNGVLTITIDPGTPAVAATPATPAQDVVHANITVEVTKKELKNLVVSTGATPGVTTTRNLTDKDNGLKNVLAELASGANSVLGVGLAVPFDGASGNYGVLPAVADVTASDYAQTVKIYQYPYKSFLNNNLYTATSNYNLEGLVQGEGGDVLNHIYEVKTDDTSKKINPISVQAVINDAIAKHGEVTFTFNTATKKVAVGRDAHNIEGWMAGNPTSFAGQHWGNPIGSYVDNDWDACSVADFRTFGNHYYNDNQAGYDPNTTYILNNWLGDNLFNGTLIVNSNLTLALNDTQKFDWTATSLSFTWEAIQDEALTTNQYANYIQNMVLRTSADWYWDNFQVILGETEVEEVESGAPVEGDVEDLPEDEEETDLGASDEEEEEEEEEEESEPAPEVAPAVESNPGTGNAPVALAVIPVALAAAAIVAKKRG